MEKVLESGMENLTEEQRLLYEKEISRKKKSNIPAYFLWIIGLHYAYFGKWGIQVLFYLTAGGCTIWWLIDLFRIPGIIRNINLDRSIEVLKNIKSITK